MTTTRLLLRRNSRPSDLFLPSSSSPTSSLSRTRILKCSLGLGSDGQNQKPSFKDKERKSSVEVKAYVPTSEMVVTSKTEARRGFMDSVFLVSQVTDILITELRQAIKRRAWKLQLQRNIERVILDCRFYTLFAVTGTLLGSVLCFFEGCSRVLECYSHYLMGLSHGVKSNTIHILIEAIDMFLFGTSMLVLGNAIYNMFVSCKINQSNQSIGEVKTRIGYAVVMILHVGMMEKFKTTPLVTCMDLACFAASLFILSASMFLLSRLSSSL
ncbi:hypothetical protein Bca4012_060721 [Brassica carinata]|uniref:Uncharacterized protein n=1 Tax=Brassica carinata TaxID=52824 RepID=A0A8X7V690_BRACI|nr:hypothetical protein Bca52824_031067 [Brassica carinata]